MVNSQLQVDSKIIADISLVCLNSKVLYTILNISNIRIFQSQLIQRFFGVASDSIVDVSWGQPIKLIQMASNSELCENQWNNLLFPKINDNLYAIFPCNQATGKWD